MVGIEQAKEFLRIDGDYMDDILAPLLETAPDYIAVTTGMTAEKQKDQPLADTVTKFLLMLWLDFPESCITDLQRTIDNLLKALSAKARAG